MENPYGLYFFPPVTALMRTTTLLFAGVVLILWDMNAITTTKYRHAGTTTTTK